MLEAYGQIVSNGVLSLAKENTHFAIWVIFKSLIIHGTDLTRLRQPNL